MIEVGDKIPYTSADGTKNYFDIFTQERKDFCDIYLSGETATDAYRQCGHYALTLKETGIAHADKTINRNAYKILHKLTCQQYLADRRLEIAAKAGFTIEQNNRDIIRIKDADYAATLEQAAGKWVFKHIAEMHEDVRFAVKKFKLGDDGRPTEIEFHDRVGQIFKVTDILQRITTKVELSNDESARIVLMAKHMKEAGIEPDIAKSIITAYMAEIGENDVR